MASILNTSTMNAQMCLTYTIYIYHSLSHVASAGQTGPAHVMRFSTRLTGYLFTRRTQVSFQACVEECQHTIVCHSVNYDRRKTLCEINSKRISDLTNAIAASTMGSVYWEKPFVHVAVTCGQSACTNRETCDRASRTCISTGCKPYYINQAFGTVTGNMNDVNSKVHVTCFSDNVVPAATWTPVCKETGLWDVVPPCEQVCSKGWVRFSGKCYKFVLNGRAWDKAKLYCENEGAYLVIVNDEAEHVFLSDTARRKTLQCVWIGLRYVSTASKFLWVDGSSVTFQKFYQNEPNNRGCAFMLWAWGYLWNDSFEYCADVCIFVCEKEINGI